MSPPISTTIKIIGILAGIFFLYSIRDVIAYLLLAFIFASALRPAVDFLESKKIPRVISSVVIFLLFLGFVTALFWSIFPVFISETQNFISSFPKYWQQFLDWLPRFEEWRERVPFGENIENAINQSLQSVSKAITSIISFTYNIFGQVFNLVFVLVAAFYLVVEKKTNERFTRFFFGRDKELEGKILRYWQLAEKQAGLWLQGYVFLSLIVGLLVYIGLSILGVKYALILAVFAGAFEIVPFLGPLFSMVVGFFLVFFQAGIVLALWTVFIFFIVQQLENYLIVPLVMKNRIDLNPLVSIIVLFIGAKLGGVLGAILAIPLTAILLKLYRDITKT